MDNQEITNEKKILNYVREGERKLFEYIHDQSDLSGLLDILCQGDEFFALSELRERVQKVLKEIHRLFKEEKMDISDIDSIIDKIKPLLSAADQEIGKAQEEMKEEEKQENPCSIPVQLNSLRNFNNSNNNGPYQRPAIDIVESQEIEDLYCIYEFDFIEIHKLIENEQGMKEKLKSLVFKKLIYLDSGKPIEITMKGDLKKYQIVEDINITDELGEWRFHPFFDRMAVYLVREGNKDFPTKWHVPRNFVLTIKAKERKSTQSAQSGGGDLTLPRFLEELAEKHEKDKNQTKSWVEAFNSQAVDTVEELLNWEKKDFDELKSIPKQIKIVLQQELNKFKFKSMNNAQINLNEAERKGIVHKIKRFLYFQTGESDKLGYIDQKVLELAFNDVKTYYEGESLLQQIKTFYLGYSVPMKKKGNIILERGMILYGPPGTGKTILTDDLPLKMGLTPISHSLSASEVFY